MSSRPSRAHGNRRRDSQRRGGSRGNIPAASASSSNSPASGSRGNNREIAGRHHRGRGWRNRGRSATRKRNSRRNHQSTFSRLVNVPGIRQPPPQNNDDASDDDEEEIPGFYYDREKKRYYQVLPGQNNTISGAVTQSSLNAKLQEEKRLKDLAGCSSASTLNHRLEKQPMCHIHGLVEKAQRGILQDVNFRNCLQSQIFRRFRLHGTTSVCKNPMNIYEKVEHFKSFLLTRDRSKILGLWSVAGLITQRIQMLKIAQMMCDRNPVLKVEPIGTHFLQSLSRVTHITWAPMTDSISDNRILYTTSSVMDYSPSLAMIRNLDCPTLEGFRHTEFNLGSAATWTCAWNYNLKRFSVGSEKCGLLLDVETRRMWELYSEKSDVLAQTFAHNHGHILFSGTRAGRILLHDLRSMSTHPAQSFKHKSSVCHVHLSSDVNYLYAADFSGKINMWDLRQNHVVLSYKGHNNEYSSIPFHVDEEDNLLYSAGQDCYTRLWNLRSGFLIKSIPPPFLASRDAIPALVYSSQWSVRPGHPTLLLGMNSLLHLYSL